MELIISFLSIGIAIVTYTIWRFQRLDVYSNLLEVMETEFDIENIDFSGQTKYTNCVSHQWVIDSVVRKKHSKIGSMFQDHLFNNTLLATMWIALGIGMAGLLISLVLLRSMEVAGLSVFILLGGVLMLLGPGSVKVSDELLAELSSRPMSDLCNEDYSYAKISYDTIRKWLIISLIVGIGIVAIAPFAQMIPAALALSISIFTQYIIWTPAMFLMEVWFPLAFVYLVGIIPVFMYIGWRIIRVIRGPPEDRDQSGYQW